MKKLPNSHARLYVDIRALNFNLEQFKKILPSNVEILPMVKAHAYGAGLKAASKIYKDCKKVAVADAKEAVIARKFFPNSEIILIYQAFENDLDIIYQNNFIPAVSNINFAEKLNQVAKKSNKKIKIHIEIDTGAGRFGVLPKDVELFAEKIKNLKNIEVEGLFMHYTCADSFEQSDLIFTKNQTELFKKAVDNFEKIYGKVKLKHACSSEAILNSNTEFFDMVRPGYMLYGYYQIPELRKKIELKPALAFAADISLIKELEPNTPISYSRTFYTKRKTKIAVVTVGYSDGLPRSLSNKGFFVVNGQRAPIVGRICMDSTMIDITDITGDIKLGDSVYIFDNKNVTIEEIAEKCGTIGYEIISRIDASVDRIEV